jgi:hypothetical protein
MKLTLSIASADFVIGFQDVFRLQEEPQENAEITTNRESLENNPSAFLTDNAIAIEALRAGCQAFFSMPLAGAKD